MTFKESVSTCFSKYITFSGRAMRSEFWYFQLFLFIGSFVTAFLDALVSGGNFANTGPLGGAFSLITFIPSIAVTARRLHDIDKSGWWQLGWLLIAIALTVGLTLLLVSTDTIFGSNMADSTFAVVLIVIVGIGTALIWPLYWLTRKSDYETNRFGPPPWETGDV